MCETPGWTVYILECADRTLYTGITTDLARRIDEHTNRRGAKYTRGRAPFTLLHTETHKSRSHALKREAEIKTLDAASKRRLASPRRHQSPTAPADCAEPDKATGSRIPH